MTTPAPVGCAKNSDLPTINQVGAQNEAVLGPLIDIGNDGAQTILTFDTDGAAPAKGAVLTADQGGQPDVPTGSSKIKSGQVFVSGALTGCTSSRPN